MADDAPHEGCNCGKRRRPEPAAPLLVGDLVIAARDRAREPELPAATVERALATPLTPRLARYDFIVVASEAPADAEHEARLIAEFARHEHRVFVLQHGEPSSQHPSAPTVHYQTISALTLDTLAALRHEHAIEAAAFLLPSPTDPILASEIRQRWGWRMLTMSSGGEAPLPSEWETAGGVLERESLPQPTDALARRKAPLPSQWAGYPLGGGWGEGSRDESNMPTSPRAAGDPDLHITFNAPVHREKDNLLALPRNLSWPARWAALDAALRQTWPRVSVIVLTHDNLAFTRLCLASVLENTDYPNYELVVVDNASTDGTVEELRRLASTVPHVRLIFNDFNAGFGAGNNQGISAAAGDILVLLNNDTIVPRGWLTRLALHLDDSTVGLIGPATNRTCNEAQLNPPYQTYAEYQAVAREFALHHEGARRPIRMLAMFCTAFRRDTIDRVGLLDERYEVGMFEDEDYALRVKEAGLDVVWTPEVYVHHAYHASIGKLLPSGEYMRLVKLNQGRFEEKWGICWERHRPLPPPAATT